MRPSDNVDILGNSQFEVSNCQLQNSLVGQWHMKYGFSSGYRFVKVTESYIFNSDGTGSYLYEDDCPYFPDNSTSYFECVVSDNRITFHGDGDVSSWEQTFKVNGNELTIAFEGMEEVYMRLLE